MLVFLLSSIALLGLSKRQTISSAASTPSAASTTPAAISMPVIVPAAAPRPTEPVPARVDAVKRDQTMAVESASVPSRPSVPSPPEVRDADVGDGTAAIDWLLKTSRRGS